MACAVALGACSTATPGDSPDASAGSVCTIVETSRDTLVTPAGERVFVSPAAVAANADGHVLIVGRPNYLFQVGHGGSATLRATDALLGVQVGPGGLAMGIEAPVDPRTISVVDALAREDGGWDVVFGEDAEPYALWDRPLWDPVRTLWYGVLRGTEWGSLEEIPVPAGWRVHATSSGALARAGGDLVWALEVVPPRSFAAAGVFRREDGGWSAEAVGIGSAAYFSMAPAGGAGVVVAAAGGGPDGRAPLRVWEADSTGRERGVTIPAPSGLDVHRPVLRRWGNRVTATWESIDTAGVRVYALADALAVPPRAPILLASNPTRRATPTSLSLPDGAHLWIAMQEAAGSGADTLRFVEIRPTGDTLRTSLPYPFLGSFAAASSPSGDPIVLTGAVPLDSSVASLVLRVHRQCSAVASATTPLRPGRRTSLLPRSTP